jgi:hypothetical protein
VIVKEDSNQSNHEIQNPLLLVTETLIRDNNNINWDCAMLRCDAVRFRETCRVSLDNPWRWWQQVPLKQWYLSMKMHMSQLFYPDDGGNRHLRNIGTHLRNYSGPNYSFVSIEGNRFLRKVGSIYRTIGRHNSPTVKTHSAGSSETLVPINQTTRSHMPDYRNFNIHVLK